MFNITRKDMPQFFFIGNVAFLFSKNCAINKILGVTENLQLQIKHQKTSWNLINCSLRFGLLDNTRKKTARIFVTVKIA